MQVLGLINLIADLIHAKRYLEIGTAHGDIFYNLKIPYKDGVDKGETLKDDPKNGLRFFHLSDTEFFKLMKRERFDKYDLIFIDADHTFKQSLFDLKNCINLISQKGIILMHDVNPTNETMTKIESRSGIWTGEVWKTILYLDKNIGGFDFITYPGGWGLSIIFRSKNKKVIESKKKDLSYFRRLTYSYFEKNKNEFMKFRSPEKIKSILESKFNQD